MNPNRVLTMARHLPESLRVGRVCSADVIGAIATLRAETLQRAAAGGGSGLGKHVYRCYRSFRRIGVGRLVAIEQVWRVVITAVRDEANGKARGCQKPLDKQHYHR